MTDQQALETRIAVHEATSLARYDRIEERLTAGDRRMSKIEHLLYAVIIVVLFGPGVAAEFVKKMLGL